MKNRREGIGIYLLETMLFLASMAGILMFYFDHECPLELPFRILWGAALLILVPLLICGEWRLHRKKKRSGCVTKAGIHNGEET